MIKELETYKSLPEDVKPAILALSILIERIGSLPKADRDDLFELLQEWRKADDPEEQRSIHRAMDEILAQIPVRAKALPLAEDKPMSRGLKAWTEHVGGSIRSLREQAGLTQDQLSERAGLPQSHVSRLERAMHSPTNLTLEKIANALGVDIKQLDPCAE